MNDYDDDDYSPWLRDVPSIVSTKPFAHPLPGPHPSFHSRTHAYRLYPALVLLDCFSLDRILSDLPASFLFFLRNRIRLLTAFSQCGVGKVRCDAARWYVVLPCKFAMRRGEQG